MTPAPTICYRTGAGSSLDSIQRRIILGDGNPREVPGGCSVRHVHRPDRHRRRVQRWSVDGAGSVLADGALDGVDERLGVDAGGSGLAIEPWIRLVDALRSLDRLRDAATASARAERDLYLAVNDARAAGRTWDEIARAVGVTRQAAHARWAHRVELPQH